MEIRACSRRRESGARVKISSGPALSELPFPSLAARVFVTDSPVQYLCVNYLSPSLSLSLSREYTLSLPFPALLGQTPKPSVGDLCGLESSVRFKLNHLDHRSLCYTNRVFVFRVVPAQAHAAPFHAVYTQQCAPFFDL